MCVSSNNVAAEDETAIFDYKSNMDSESASNEKFLMDLVARSVNGDVHGPLSLAQFDDVTR
jgi:hypothetical protein